MFKLLIAGILGGIVVFTWSFVSHMILHLGESGIQAEATPGQASVLRSMGANLDKAGFYLMPGEDPTIADEQQRMEQMMEAWKAGPTAVLVYSPVGRDMADPMIYIREGVTNILCGLIAACVLCCVRSNYLCRVALVALMGVFAWLSIDASYWIWYGFPTEYLLAQGVDQTVGWGLAGILIAAIARPRATPSEA